MTFYNLQNLYKIFPQNAGNAISDTLDFKIFWGYSRFQDFLGRSARAPLHTLPQ